MNDLDDWLNALNLESTPDENEALSTEIVQHIESQLQIQPQELSENDFNEILSDIGFNPVPEADAEEIHEVGEDDEEEEEEAETINNNGISVVPLTEEELAQAQRNFVHTTIDENTASQEPLVPENSPTLLMDDTTSRFSGTEWYDLVRQQRIILAGLGGIGSWLALQLARLHPDSLYLYDDDHVENNNMSGQLYSYHDINRFKVDAISRSIREYSSLGQIYAVSDKFTEHTAPGDIMICGFDSMTARKTFFYKWIEHLDTVLDSERRKCLFIDGRLSIDTLQIFCITGNDDYNIGRYQKEFLFSDAEADETVCSLKQTSYMAGMIGSMMTNLFVNFVAGLTDPVMPYDLPFFTEYDAQNMIFKTVH